MQQLAAQLGETLNEGNSAAVIAQLRSEVARMRQLLSHTGSLSGNLVREGKWIENMNRPARPDGWRVPTPRAQP